MDEFTLSDKEPAEEPVEISVMKQRMDYWDKQAGIAYQQLIKTGLSLDDDITDFVSVYTKKFKATNKCFYFILERLCLEKHIDILKRYKNTKNIDDKLEKKFDGQPIEFKIINYEVCAHQFDGFFLTLDEVIRPELSVGVGSYICIKTATDSRWQNTLNWFIVNGGCGDNIDEIIGYNVGKKIIDSNVNKMIAPNVYRPYPRCFTNNQYVFKFVNTSGKKMKITELIDKKEYLNQLTQIVVWRISHPPDQTVSKKRGTQSASTLAEKRIKYGVNEGMLPDTTDGEYWRFLAVNYRTLLGRCSSFRIQDINYINGLRSMNKYFYYLLELLFLKGNIAIKRVVPPSEYVNTHPIEFRIIKPDECQPHFNRLFLLENNKLSDSLSPVPGSVRVLKTKNDTRWKRNINWFIAQANDIPKIDAILGVDPCRLLTQDDNAKLSQYVKLPYPESFSNTSHVFKYLNTNGENLKFGQDLSFLQQYYDQMRNIDRINSIIRQSGENTNDELGFFGDFNLDELFREREFTAQDEEFEVEMCEVLGTNMDHFNSYRYTLDEACDAALGTRQDA